MDRPADGESTGEHSCGERPDLYAAFCAEYDLSPRESEVFRLWVTGHGLEVHPERAVRLGVHGEVAPAQHLPQMRDTHNRDEIIALFERETSEFG
ncbi:MAG: hypothetical protein ACLTDR_14605 [Adlercreutzia equolifaciens]